MSIVVAGLKLVAYLSSHGNSYVQGLQIDNKPFPVKWEKQDWNRIRIGSEFELTDYFTGHGLWQSPYRISAIVSDFDLTGVNSPWIELENVKFEGHKDALDINMWGGSWGNFFPNNDSFKDAVVEPYWLLPNGISIPWNTYQQILKALNGWEPIHPLSLAELHDCVKEPDYNDSDPVPDQHELLKLLDQDGFSLDENVKKRHNALRLAKRIYGHYWPDYQQESLILLVDLEAQSWAWIKEGSIYVDRTSLMMTHIKRDEFSEEHIFAKLMGFYDE